MNFTKELTDGMGHDMMTSMDNPASADQLGRIEELEEQEKLMYVLHEIAETSEDAESVRLAFIALTSTSLGQAYMKENPITL